MSNGGDGREQPAALVARRRRGRPSLLDQWRREARAERSPRHEDREEAVVAIGGAALALPEVGGGQLAAGPESLAELTKRLRTERLPMLPVHPLADYVVDSLRALGPGPADEQHSVVAEHFWDPCDESWAGLTGVAKQAVSGIPRKTCASIEQRLAAAAELTERSANRQLQARWKCTPNRDAPAQSPLYLPDVTIMFLGLFSSPQPIPAHNKLTFVARAFSQRNTQ